MAPLKLNLAILDWSSLMFLIKAYRLLYMTVSRTLIRAIALEDISPAQTLERVNHLLQLDSSQGFL